MPKEKLNHQIIKGIDVPKKRIEIFDTHTNGLGLRVTKTGTKTFFYRYRFSGKTKRFTIGTFPEVSLAEARNRTRKLKVKLNDGIDPQAEKKERRYKQEEATFKEVSIEFIDKYLPTLRAQTAKEYQRHIESYLKPLNDIPLNKLGKSHILSILDQKAYKDAAPTQANRIRATLSSLFSFAEKRGVVNGNLIKSIPTYKTGNTKRSRYYSEVEIQELWEYFDSFIQPTGEVFKMLLLTGQRKTETMRMRWDNIRGDVWTIPAEIAKNGQPHDIPLSDIALQIIEGLRPLTGDTDYVFNSPRKDNQAISSIKNSKEKIQSESTITDFRPHDLRRTVATYCAKLGVDRTVLGKILNHKGLSGDSQVTAIYDRHSYMKEKRQALNRWSDKLQQVIEGTETKIFKIG